MNIHFHHENLLHGNIWNTEDSFSNRVAKPPPAAVHMQVNKATEKNVMYVTIHAFISMVVELNRH